MTKFLTKDRKIFIHSAHPNVGVSRVAQASRIDRYPLEPLKIDIFSKPAEADLCRRLIDWSLLNHSDTHWLFQSHCDLRDGETYPLEETDCTVLLCGAEPFSAGLLAQIESLARRGSGLMVLGAGSQTSPEWEEFSRKMLGASFGEATPAIGNSVLRIAPGQYSHPLVRDVCSWPIGWTRTAFLDARAELLLEGIHGDKTQPSTWLLDTGWDKTFCTLLGTRQDFQQRSFFSLIGNALRWMLGTV